MEGERRSRVRVASSASADKDDVVSDINVTPLVDITLVLLIVFIVTARIIVGQTLPMDLPKAATGGEQQVVLAIELAKDGAIAVNGKRVESDKAVQAIAHDTLAKNPDVRVVIDADENVPHGRVVKVMDETKQAGITRIAFGVSPAQ
jgi:biopolymer transport protein ExbD